MLSLKAPVVCELSLCCVFLFLVYGVQSDYILTKKTLELMSKYRLIDGHNDLPLQIRMLQNNKLSKFNLYNSSKTATDITRLRAAHVGGQMFAAYVLCTAQDMDAVRLALEQIDVIRRMCTEYPELELATTAAEMNATKKIACLISVEGGHAIDSSLAALRMFYQLGVRSVTLTHTCNTPWAESVSLYHTYYKRDNNSLTDFGKAVVHEMNRLGMMVDLSHTSWTTARAVLKLSKAPVIFSHSSAYTICNNTRNVPDDLLLMLKENGGLIMVNFYNGFIACGAQATVSLVADHFDYLKSVIGAEHIGIGGDYDGASGFPQGLEDVSKYPALIGELLRRKWSEVELAGVLRFNFLRVFKKVEKIRDELRNTLPSEIVIPSAEAQNKCRLVLAHPDTARKVKSSGMRVSYLLGSGALFWTVFFFSLFAT
ncbi:dipeptidase 3 [Tachysurus fulvidraco]|uniref:dipeptidase 3 n=1 Tax=Tachysurus fulvidraco TaxID=1234273 RepID=UPI000F50A2F3|nr:dipeptidase 3 [Tachysurus fulvidraco]